MFRALLLHALLALLGHSQCGCGICKAVTSLWSYNSCLSQYCERGDLYCDNSCVRCASCWNQDNLQLCKANEAQCNVQYHSAKQGIIALGPSVSKAALCVWIVDLRQNRDDVESWTLRVDINATTSGKLVVVAYEITDGAQLFDLDGRQSHKIVFGREEALQQTHEVKLTSNYLQISFSTSSKQSSYSGFSLSWVPEESSSSSNDFLAKVISIIAVTLLIVICCGCCGICCYKIFHNFRSGRRYMISRIAPTVDRPRRMRYNEVPRDQTVIVISEENLEALIPKSKYRSDMLEVGEAVCTVCLEEFQQGTEVRKLPCKHLFHSRCIEEWLASIGNVPNCPMCKLNPFQTVIDAHISVNEVRSEHNSMMLRSDDDLMP